MAIARRVEAEVALDTPINVHLTGCPNSCAQHYIGDIGLLACRVPVTPDGDDTVEGFHVFVGGGFGADAAIARELRRDVRIEDCPELIARILEAYMANRTGPSETFLRFSQRTDIGALQDMIAAEGMHA
jgi:ferredoxin-nitrite reductase